MRRVVLLALSLLAGVLPAQVQNADFEAPQQPGALPAGPWRNLEGRSRIEPAGALQGVLGDGGFPSQGSQWLRVSNAFTGPAVLPVPTDPVAGTHPPGFVAEVRQAFVADGTGVLSFDWSFITGEGTPPGAWNDFASIDVIDPATNQNVANLLFVDAGGLGTTLNVPGAQNGPTGPLVYSPAGTQFPGREVMPLGPKRATVAVPALQPGQVYELVLIAGNLADASVTSFLYVDAFSGLPATPILRQWNTPRASLELSGVPCQSPDSWPLRRQVRVDDVFTLTMGTYATGATPYALFATAGTGVAPVSGVSTIAGFLDLDPTALAPAPFGPLVVIVNGISGTSLLDVLLGSTDPTGRIDIPLSMPQGATGIVGSFQGLCVDPVAPFGLTLTAATQLEAAPTNGLAPNLQGTLDLGLGDEDVGIVLLNGITVPFYGANYTDLWVSANGFITFQSPVFEPEENTLQLRDGPPRIAVFWDDLDPGAAGTVAITETANDLLISWVGVRERGRTTTVSCAVVIDVSGQITLHYGRMEAVDGLAGIAPGNASPVGPTTGYGIDLNVAAAAASAAGPSDGIFQWFRRGRFDLEFCLPAGPGGPLTFQPVGTPPVPGAQGYLMF